MSNPEPASPTPEWLAEIEAENGTVREENHAASRIRTLVAEVRRLKRAAALLWQTVDAEFEATVRPNPYLPRTMCVCGHREDLHRVYENVALPRDCRGSHEVESCECFAFRPAPVAVYAWIGTPALGRDANGSEVP